VEPIVECSLSILSGGKICNSKLNVDIPKHFEATEPSLADEFEVASPNSIPLCSQPTDLIRHIDIIRAWDADQFVPSSKPDASTTVGLSKIFHNLAQLKNKSSNY
jgi:hypothetical protein